MYGLIPRRPGIFSGLVSLGLAALLVGCQASPAAPTAFVPSPQPSPAPPTTTVMVPTATALPAAQAGASVTPSPNDAAVSAMVSVVQLPTAGGAASVFAPVAGKLSALGPAQLGQCKLPPRLPGWVSPQLTTSQDQVSAQPGPGAYRVTVARQSTTELEVGGGGGAYGNYPGLNGRPVLQQGVDLGGGVHANVYQGFPAQRSQPFVAWSDLRSGWRYQVDGQTPSDAIQRAKALVSALGPPTRRTSAGGFEPTVPTVPGSVAGGEIDITGTEVYFSWWPTPGCGYFIKGPESFSAILRMAATMTTLGQGITALAPIGSRIVLAGGSGGAVWRSADAGQSWESVAVLGDGPVRRFAVLNGMILASSGPDTLWGSSDGGQSWTVTSVSPFGGELTDGPWALNGQAEVLITPPSTSSSSSPDRRLIRSTDAGRTWLPVGTVPTVLQTGSIIGSLTHVFPLNASIWMGPIEVGLTCSLPGALAGSRDGGQSWNILPSPATPFTLKAISAVAVTPSNWFLAGRQCHGSGAPVMYETMDAGSSWRAVSLNLSADTDLNAIAFATSQQGAVVGERGASLSTGELLGKAVAQATTDGGKTWTVLGPPSLPGLTGLACFDAGPCLAWSQESTGLAIIRFSRPGS